MNVIRGLIAACVSLGVVIGFTILGTAPASASSVLKFTTFVADSPGADRGSNKSLNAEYITIRNSGSKTITLTGYRIKDAQGHTFTFPKGFKLKAKKSVKVHTGSGKNTKANLYWKSHWYIWNNTKDTARLLNKSGKKLDSCTYHKRKSGRVSC